MEKIYLEIPKDIFENANFVFDELGLDVNSAVRMFLKRVSQDKSIAFLLPQNNGFSNTVSESDSAKDAKEEKLGLTKSLAVRLFRERGHVLSKNITFASKNRSANNYWANPDFSVLDQDWCLILNDWIDRKVYLFKIPARTILPTMLVCRNDKKNYIDLQIAYGDISFTDNRSEYSFKQFLIDSIEY